ncbi:hypothetical protein Bbelb_319840 [Branchiostoma belcheri]|nr:hypothetical protein Bbelb_319840 [Branchiostoma belcheri]
MYEQAQPVRSPVVGPGNRQTSGPQAQAPSLQKSGLHGRARHGNAAYHKRQKGLETSSDTYEDAETVNLSPPIREARLQRAGLRGEPPMEGADDRNIRRHVNSPDATDTSTDNTYRSETNGRRGLRDFVRPYRGCILGVTAVVATLVILGLVVVMFNVKKEITQLSGTLGALKRDVDGISRLSDTVDALKRDNDGISRLSDTVDALKRDVDGISRLRHIPTVRHCRRLERDVNGISRLSDTVDALKRDVDGISRLSDTVDALKRDVNGISRLSDTVDALKRDNDGISRLSDTVDALKRDVNGISRLSDTVDGLNRKMDALCQLSETVDALRRHIDNERNSTAENMECLSEKATPVHYSGCKNPAILKGNFGSFTSPGYPNNYNNNAQCSWTITVCSGRRAAIRFISLNLEKDSGCMYDSLTVYDGSTSSGTELGKFCGTTGRDVVASRRTAHIIFTSDSSNSGTGFSIKFSGEMVLACRISATFLKTEAEKIQTRSMVPGRKLIFPHKETLIVPYLLEGPSYQTFSRKQPDFLYQPGWWYRLAQVLRGRPQRYDWQG